MALALEPRDRFRSIFSLWISLLLKAVPFLNGVPPLLEHFVVFLRAAGVNGENSWTRLD